MAVSLTKPSDLVTAAAEEIVWRTSFELAAEVDEIGEKGAAFLYRHFREWAEGLTPEKRAYMRTLSRHGGLAELALIDVMREHREL